jgi:hypothetical protein
MGRRRQDDSDRHAEGQVRTTTYFDGVVKFVRDVNQGTF